VNAKSNGGWTTFHFAAENVNVDILHLLVENGADLEAQNNLNMRALHRAASNSNMPFLQNLILRYQVDITTRRNNGRTTQFALS
jgi:ankyrin repeat protein